jgi:hypothetical protein
MNNTGTDKNQMKRAAKKEDDSLLEDLARAIDPPGREVSDEELKDPGRMTPGAPPVDNRS